MDARFTKTIFFTALSVIFAFTAITYVSCSTDKCQATVCAYGGTCDNGTCKCLPGYTGANCQSIIAQKYFGTWTVSETGTISNNANFTTAIDSSYTSLTQVLINNFYNRYPPTENVVADLQGVDSLKIHPQTMSNGDRVEGVAVYTPDASSGSQEQHGTLTIYFSVTNSSNQVDDFGYVVGLNGVPSIWSK